MGSGVCLVGQWVPVSHPALPYRRLLTSSRCQCPAPSHGTGTEPVGSRAGPPGLAAGAHGGDGEGCHGWARQQDRPAASLPAEPAPPGGRGGNEEEIPKPLSREKVTTEEKMPGRSGCPWPGHSRDGSGGLGTRETWPCGSWEAPWPRGWAVWSGSLAGPCPGEGCQGWGGGSGG